HCSCQYHHQILFCLVFLTIPIPHLKYLCCLQLSGKTRKVNHFHYTAWPDHGVPDYATSILNFHKMVMKDHKAHRGPLLVHCSAGVGRTGTFIAIDHVLEQRETEGVVDIPGVILKLRQQRTNMVQTLDQHIFIHDAILESVTCGDTEIEAGDLRKRLAQLKTKDESGRSGLDLQFAVRLLLTVHANNPRNCPSGLDGKFPLRV
ncbi:Receptor-type tyrosine-protein phosphatase delta, partial [Geodia barretti]